MGTLKPCTCSRETGSRWLCSIIYSLRKSAQSVDDFSEDNPRKSAFHHVCSSLKNPASGASVSALIRVHLRFFKNVILQTGLTGSTGYIFNPVYPVILSNSKYQLTAPWQSVKLTEGGWNDKYYKSRHNDSAW